MCLHAFHHSPVPGCPASPRARISEFAYPSFNSEPAKPFIDFVERQGVELGPGMTPLLAPADRAVTVLVVQLLDSTAGPPAGPSEPSNPFKTPSESPSFESPFESPFVSPDSIPIA